MNDLAWRLLAATVATAGTDWWAVATHRRRIEHFAKPLTMVLLIAAALTLDLGFADAGPVRAVIVAALGLSLAGDVFLMYADRYFIQGLGSFLLAHVGYIAALAMVGRSAWAFLGLGVTAISAIVLARPILRGARSHDDRLAIPVAAYMAAISLMVIAAFGTRTIVLILGALLFYASDAVLGWNRFVRPLPQATLKTHVPYHLGQMLLVVGLTTV